MKRKTCWSSLPIFFCLSIALAIFPMLASTCIVSTPAGDRDPHHALSSAVVTVDAGAGTAMVMDASLEARFKTFGASLGIGITTKPLGFQFSVK